MGLGLRVIHHGGGVEIEEVGATLRVAPVFADANLRDQGSDRLADADHYKD